MEKVKKATSGLAFRIISGTLFLLIGFALLISAIGYVRFTESLTNEYNDSAFRTAETAAAFIDGDKIEEYLATGGNTEEYAYTWNMIDVICQKQNVTLLYVLQPDVTDYGRFLSVINVVNHDSGFSPWEVGYQRDTTNDEYRNIYKNIYENGLERASVVRTTNLRGNEPHITSLIPIKRSDGTVSGILCVQRPMSELQSGRMGYLKWVAISAAALAVLSSIVAAVFLNNQFVKPVKQIIVEAKRFAKENKKTEEQEWINSSNIREIGDLAQAVNKMEDDTVSYMENLTNITAEKERIGTELALATKIQADMLPNIFPAFPEREEIDIYASMTPAKEVGGDFYDFFLIDDDHLGMVMADVSGKGVPAALFMMMSKNLVSNYTLMGGGPAKVLERVNKTICKNNDNDMFVTVWLGILTISTGKVVAANAGHEYPIIKKADGQFEVFKDKHGFVIGGMDGVKYREYEFILEKEDILYLYTDGVPEATNADEEMFGLERLTEALNQNPEANLQELLTNVKASVDNFVGEAPQFDDLTMLAIRLR